MEINSNIIYNLLIKILQNKSLIHNHNVQKQFMSEKVINSSMYFGIDITSNKIHIGHISTIYICKIIQMITNLNLIIVIGTFTSKIGDPSFRLNRRNQEYVEKISKNKNNIKNIINKICNRLDMKFQIKENHEWLNKITLNEIINYLKYFKMEDLINSRIFSKINKKNLLLNEIMYPIIQGIDFYYLNSNNNCILQIGGQDQWINMLYGHDIIKNSKNKNSYIITIPLLTDKNGNKISKSNKNSPLFINENSKILETMILFNKINNCTKNQINNILRHIYKNEKNNNISKIFIKSIFNVNDDHSNRITECITNKKYAQISSIIDQEIKNKHEWIDEYKEINNKTIIRSIYRDSTSKIIDIAIKSGCLFVNEQKINSLSDIKKLTIPNKTNYIKNNNDVYFYLFKTNASF